MPAGHGAADQLHPLALQGHQDQRMAWSRQRHRRRGRRQPGSPRAQCLLGAASEVFTSFADAADQAGWSRRYGGIHFEDGDLKGRTLGHQVGTAVWARTVTSFNGTAIAPPPRPPRSRPPPTVAPTTHGGAHHHRGADHDDRGTNDHH